MAGRREVDTNRPEHSWIPFYRELAEKLVNDGWRERQGELVGVLQRLQANGIPMPRLVEFMRDDVDPFTVFALFSRVLTFENASRVMDALKAEFGISADLPKEQPFIPYADNRSVGYFSGFVSIAHEIATMWDLFEIVYGINDFDEIPEHDRLLDLIDEALEVNYVGISKLTSALYWVNPYYFLHSHTVNAVGGKDFGLEARDAASYVKCLVRTRELTEPSFPETNIAVFKSQDPDWEPPKVWIVRGGSRGQSVEYQLENRMAGIGFNLGSVDLSAMLDGEVIREAYASHNPDAGDGRIRANAGSVANFVRDIRICDYVLMPDGYGQRIHYGKVVSDPYHVSNGPWENRRDVEWGDRVLSRSNLPSFPARTRTVTQASDGVKEEFLSWFDSRDSEIEYDENEDYESDRESEDARPYGIAEMLKDGLLFFNPTELQRILDRFEDKKNLILQGPPGVGKTFVTRGLAYALMGEKADDRIVNVQFHQSYSYEEFVQGYRPATNSDQQLIFEREDGVFLKLCDLAFEASQTDPDLKFVMIIDEINRGNLSRVFGELLSMIEKDKRGGRSVVELPSGARLSVPDNVYILGTMNLADRSLAGMDYAMRRRFAFVSLRPQFGESMFVDWLRGRGVPEGMITRINDGMSELNGVIASDASLGRNFAVGHSYFCDIADGGEDDWDGWYREIVETEIKPLLEEYWFDDLGKADGEVGKLLEGVA